MRKKADKWDKRFLQLASLVASWSKDPSTKVGAIAVNAKRQVLSTGYNGFPRGFDDSEERYNTREIKYKYILHAEQNLISNAAANGISLTGSRVYVVGMPPCAEKCALQLIQSDINAVMVPNLFNEHDIEEDQYDWFKSWSISVDLFNEAGIDVVLLD